jgi:hypothetical protein
MPGFLRMHVETTSSLLDLHALPDADTERVYLHEYCHFMQNIATNFGLRHFYVVVNYLKFATNYVHQLPLGRFAVPVAAIPEATDNVDANLEIWKLYEGDGDASSAKLLAHYRTHQAQAGKEVPCVIVTYETVEGQPGSFVFGEYCLAESMAYLIERQCYPDCEPAPDLPYLAAEKLVELIFPAFGQDPLRVLALCDAALKVFNPGPFFYDTLLRIRDQQLPVDSPEAVYAICNQVAINYDGAKTTNELLPSNAEGAIRQLQDLFNDVRFDPVKAWLARIIRAAVVFRQRHEAFPVDVARAGRITGNQPFAAFLRSVGTPLTTNQRGETSLADPSGADTAPEYAFIWAIEEVQAVLTVPGKKDCKLVHFCRTSGVKVDRRCSTAPWTRTDDPACAFGQIWRHWGLDGHVPG